MRHRVPRIQDEVEHRAVQFRRIGGGEPQVRGEIELNGDLLTHSRWISPNNSLIRSFRLMGRTLDLLFLPRDSRRRLRNAPVSAASSAGRARPRMLSSEADWRISSRFPPAQSEDC